MWTCEGELKHKLSSPALLAPTRLQFKGSISSIAGFNHTSAVVLRCSDFLALISPKTYHPAVDYVGPLQEVTEWLICARTDGVDMIIKPWDYETPPIPDQPFMSI
jgi:hypothetical protein